ncbi:NF038104 family lipoprotein [Moraxella marmotae]|uniref:NF038104 family lipoprotein n=1 Tax=Moraxella marmotae TaxID=3344520 RepID=UPI0035D423C6
MKLLHAFLIVLTCTTMTACVHKIVTVPVKVAYKTTKGVVKGTVAVGKALIPGDSDDEKESKHKKK